MPYIKKDRRKDLDIKIDLLHKQLSDLGCVKGDYNYCITRLMHLYIKNVGICYDNLSNVNGVLNDIIVEFNRTVVADYEDYKILENGPIDVIEKMGVNNGKL